MSNGAIWQAMVLGAAPPSGEYALNSDGSLRIEAVLEY